MTYILQIISTSEKNYTPFWRVQLFIYDTQLMFLFAHPIFQKCSTIYAVITIFSYICIANYELLFFVFSRRPNTLKCARSVLWGFSYLIKVIVLKQLSSHIESMTTETLICKERNISLRDGSISMERKRPFAVMA